MPRRRSAAPRRRRDPGPRRLALDVEDDLAAAAAERLLLARACPAERRVPVLRARLAREQQQLLRAVAVGVDVGEEDQALPLEVAEAEVGELDPLDLLGRQDDPGRRELVRGAARLTASPAALGARGRRTPSARGR